MKSADCQQALELFYGRNGVNEFDNYDYAKKIYRKFTRNQLDEYLSPTAIQRPTILGTPLNIPLKYWVNWRLKPVHMYIVEKREGDM